MKLICISLILALLVAPGRTRLIGKRVSQDAEKKLKLIHNSQVSSYITAVGRPASFAANSVVLKFSSDAELQADLMGTQILYDSGYDPRAMAQFFEKLEEKRGSRSAEFFSDHPNPGNRTSIDNQESTRPGGAKRPESDSTEFQRIKRILKST